MLTSDSKERRQNILLQCFISVHMEVQCISVAKDTFSLTCFDTGERGRFTQDDKLMTHDSKRASKVTCHLAESLSILQDNTSKRVSPLFPWKGHIH